MPNYGVVKWIDLWNSGLASGHVGRCTGLGIHRLAGAESHSLSPLADRTTAISTYASFLTQRIVFGSSGDPCSAPLPWSQVAWTTSLSPARVWPSTLKR